MNRPLIASLFAGLSMTMPAAAQVSIVSSAMPQTTSTVKSAADLGMSAPSLGIATAAASTSINAGNAGNSIQTAAEMGVKTPATADLVAVPQTVDTSVETATTAVTLNTSSSFDAIQTAAQMGVKAPATADLVAVPQTVDTSVETATTAVTLNTSSSFDAIQTAAQMGVTTPSEVTLISVPEATPSIEDLTKLIPDTTIETTINTKVEFDDVQETFNNLPTVSSNVLNGAQSTGNVSGLSIMETLTTRQLEKSYEDTLGVQP